MRQTRILPVLARAIVVLAALALTGAALAQEKVTLRAKGEKGQIARYKGNADIELEAMGQKITVNIKETSRATVADVAENGNVTIERVTESSEQTVNGQKIPSEGESPDSSTYVLAPNGSLLSFKAESQQPDPEKVSLRLFLSQQPVFSDQAVGVGDTWTHQHTAETPEGARGATSSYELTAFEDVGTAKTAKIVMTYQESGANGVSGKATLWVEIASGDVVKSEFSVENIPLPGPTGPLMGKAKGISERTAGGPVKGTGPEASAEPEPKKIDDVVKGFEKLDGAVTLYRKVTSGRQQLYMELKKDQLGKLMMLQATAGTGNSEQVVAGNPINDIVFRFEELQKDRLTMVVPNFNFRADFGTPIGEAVRRSFADSFVEQFNIEARQPDRDSLLIEVTDFFRGDIARVNALFQGGGGPIPGLGGGRSYSLDREKTFVSSLKNFPTNLVAETTYNFTGGAGPGGLADLLGGGGTSGDPRSIVVRVVYNLFPLPTENGYRARAFDGRVGYFTVGFTDFSQNREVDNFVQKILRWDLRKQDPAAALSAPVKPITFWIDTTVPEEYRAPVREALLMWNRPFEQAGFKDAVVVKQLTKDDNVDPGDMRYNVVRWVTSPQSAYAVALFRSNPLTGEILNASITVDAGIVRFFAQEYQGVVDPGNRVKIEGEHKDHVCTDPARCRAAEDGALMARTGLIALQAMGGLVDEKEYVRQFVQWVVAHEFGHILGLRHNFVASTELSMADLKDKAKVEAAGTSASVMDYVAFNPSALGRAGVPFFGPVLGKYDHWAIEYGYRDFGRRTAEGEAASLAALASKGNSAGLGYQSDEVADGFDPYVTRFDLAADPLNYWTTMMGLTRSLIDSLEQRQPKSGRSYWELTRDFNLLLAVHGQGASQLVRWVGGMRRFANHKGDPGQRPPLAPLPGDEQRLALQTLTRRVFSESAFDLPKSLFTKLADNPNTGFVEAFLSGQNSFPILDAIANLQGRVLSSLMAPPRLARVANNEFKTQGPGALTLVEVYRAVDGAVWSELGTAKAVGQLRRELQRRHVDLLMRYMLRPPNGLPADGRMLAWNSLRTLTGRIKNAQARTTDETTKIHLAECAMRIDRALSAQETLGSQQQATPSLLEMLLGGGAKP